MVGRAGGVEKPHPQRTPVVAVDDPNAVGQGDAVFDAHAGAHRHDAHITRGDGHRQPGGDQGAAPGGDDFRLVQTGVEVQGRRALRGVVGQRDVLPNVWREGLDQKFHRKILYKTYK